MKKYYSLAIYDKETRQWYIEFSSYVRPEVEFEKTCHKGKKKILTTNDDQKSINTALAELNGETK